MHAEHIYDLRPRTPYRAVDYRAGPVETRMTSTNHSNNPLKDIPGV